MTIRFPILAACVVALAGCAAPSSYQPLATGDGYGYSEQRIERNRFRVSFSGNAATPRETVQDYLLYRAAELTLAEGADYFIVTGRGITPDAHGGGTDTRVGIGIGSGGGGLSVGTGVSIGLGKASGGPATASAEIVIRKGSKPDGLANAQDAFDARAVRRNLAPRIERPQ